MMVSTTAGGRPLKSATSRPGATHGGSIDLDAGAIWCRAPEKGGPSSEECAREVLSRGKWVRETRSGWANAAQPAGPAPRPPWACTVSVRVGSLGETHTCVRPEASCVPVRLCRGGPRSGRSTASSGRTRGRQTGLPELPRNRLQISRIVSGWSRHSPGNVSCRESASAARLSCPGMRTARSDLNCVWLQRRRWRASCDMRCDRIPPSWLIYETAAVLSVRTSTCFPNSSGRNCHKAVVTTVCRDTCSRGTPARRKARSVQGLRKRWHCWEIPTRSVPWRHAHLGTRECSQCWSGLIHSNPSGVTAAADAICPRSLWNCFSGTTFLPLKELRQFSTAWACSSVRRTIILTESNSTPRKEILCTGESLLFSQLTRSPNWLRCRSTKSLWLPNCSLDWARISQSSR